jgi:hypothetical protein
LISSDGDIRINSVVIHFFPSVFISSLVFRSWPTMTDETPSFPLCITSYDVRHFLIEPTLGFGFGDYLSLFVIAVQIDVTIRRDFAASQSLIMGASISFFGLMSSGWDYTALL